MRDKSFIREAIRRREIVQALGLAGTALLLEGCLTKGDMTQLVSMENLQKFTGAGASKFTEKDEVQMGSTLYGPTIGQAGGPFRNDRVQKAMQNLAEPMFQRSSRRNLPWEITVLEDNTVNAWALPGGKIGVNKGLLRYIATEDELAAVIAHEMGHVEKSHALVEIQDERLTKERTDIAKTFFAGKMSAYTARVPGGSELTRAALDELQGPLVKIVTSGYSRENEFAADQHILTTFERRGYDPQKSYTFFETLLRLIPPETQQTTSLYSKHPETQARVERLKGEAGKVQVASARSSASDDYAQIKRAFPTRYSPVELPTT